MSTSNISVSTAYWSKIVDASDTDFLVTWNVARTVEFATTDLDIAPQLAGHRFTREKIVTREDLVQATERVITRVKQETSKVV